MPTPRRTRSRRQTPPAEGERRAIRGYYPQYWLNATIILRELRAGRLVRLRVADPEAGRVDDLQLETPGRVDGFQVKWTEGAITFRSLLTPDGANPSLTAQLADGWKRLRERFPHLKCVVHLCSNVAPSTHDSLPTAAPPPGRRHFAAFLNEVWAPMKAAARFSLPSSESPWMPTFSALQQASSLGDNDFQAFLEDLELEFGLVLPKRPASPTRDEEIYFQDLERLTGALFQIVGDRSRTIELERSSLVSRLGWEARLEFKNKHELHVDLQHYEPIAATIAEFENAVRTLRSGYLLLVGTPGSGKSSLLTLSLRQEDVRLVRYYAFIPRSLNADRGESVNFLHDVVLSIEQDPQFRSGQGLSGFERLHLLERLRSQLVLLHDDFLRTGKKTVIMVDGLDHIAREQRPDRSLLHDLLPPAEIPDGVLFVLGSQTDGVLPPPVQVSVQRPERRITMKPLGREATFAILSRNERTSALVPDQKDRVAELSGGHPLALRYLLNQLEADGADAEAILASVHRYGVTIDEQYETHWPQIAAHPDLVKILGRLARLRRPFDLTWVDGWAGEEVVNRLQTQVAFYFRKSRGRWAFFHNSFQQFLLAKTIERTPGELDEAKGQLIHRKLADLCSREPRASPWLWEELFHRAEGADLAWFDGHPTVDELRSQLLDFRPLDAIERDLKLALRAVARRQTPVALVRLTLALKELSQREFHLENVTVIRPLLALGERDLALEHIRDGDRLRTSAEGTLQIAVALNHRAEQAEGRALFELAQPLELLTGEQPVPADHQERIPDVLRQWVRAALSMRQRTLEQVLETILRIRVHAEHPIHGQTDESITEAAQAELLVAAGRTLIDGQRWDELDRVVEVFSGRRLDWSFWLLDNAWDAAHEAGDDARARAYHHAAASKLTDNSDDTALLSIAEGYWWLCGDAEQARVVFLRITPPQPYTDTIGHDGFRPFQDRFRYARLLYLLGETRDPRALVPDPNDDNHQGAVYVLRALYRLARIAAEADRSQIKPWAVMAQDVLPLLRLFYQGGRTWSGWHAAESKRGELFALLTTVVARHGAECLDELRQVFEREWDGEESRGWWPTEVEREVILALHEEGVNISWAVERLAALESRLSFGRDASGRTEEYQAQARAWLKLREPGRAKQMLREMLRVSFGVGYRKDYQFNVWIDWLGRLLPVEPEKAIERISWFARATASLDDTTEGRAARYAANKLVTVVFRWSPRRGVRLLLWFLEQRCLWFSDALSELLETALDATSPPLAWISGLMRHVLLPTAGQVYPDLATVFLQASHRLGGVRGLEEAATELVDAVEVRALPGTRYGWKRRIAEQLSAHGHARPHVDPGPPPEDTSSRSGPDMRFLRLRGGREMSPADVLQQANSLEGFRALLADEQSDSFFEWGPVIDQLRPQLSNDEIFEMAQLIAGSRLAAMSLANLSGELLQRGDSERAWAVGEQALSRSSSYGWARWADGGSRIAAFRALHAADPDRTRPLLYHQLAEDGGGHAESLSDVLPLLAPTLPLQEVWREIEQFCQGMFPEGTLPQEGPSFPADLDDDRSVTALADLTGHLLTHPVGLLREGARRMCLELLLSGDESAFQLLAGALTAEAGKQEQALVVLGAAQSRNAGSVRPLISGVAQCAQSRHWLVRRMAQRLLQSASDTMPDVPRRPLPPIYELALPERPETPEASLPPPAPSEPIVQLGSAEQLIAPFDDYLELVASRAGVGTRNAVERAAQLMREMSPSDRWSADAERTLRSQLSSASLELPFVRPRASVARDAAHCVAAELVDAGVISAEDLDVVEGLCAFYDETLEGMSPLARDVQLVPPLSLGYLGRALEWVTLQDDDFQALPEQTPDGRVVLALWCKLKKLDWGTPSELRESTMRATDRVVQPSPDESLFGRVNFSRVVEYSDEEPRGTPEPVIVRNFAQAADTVGVRWIALNPLLANSLGWHLSSEGLFRWQDASGTTTAETLWWQDGTSEMGPAHLHEEVGFGWVVVASPEAIEQIRGRVGPLCRLSRLTRKAREQGEGERREVRSLARRF